MIDEYVDSLIDRLCAALPKALKPWSIRAANSPLGWRMQLYFGTLGRNIAKLFAKVSTEEQMDLTLQEGSDQIDDSLARVGRFFRDQVTLVAQLDARSRRIQFVGSLFLLLLAALGVVARGSAAMGVTAASLGLFFLSTAVESEYPPISAGIRQIYLVGTLLRASAITLMLLHLVGAYAAQGVPNNIVLESAVIVMLAIHALLFATMVMLNTRQPFFLRVLAGVTGTATSLTAAAGVALMAACLFRPWPMLLCGVCSCVGAIFAFMGDELIILKNLGGIRLKYYAIWVCLLLVGGFALMLVGAWMYTP